MYKLFIDDIRKCPDDKWLVVRNYSEAIQILTEYKCPTFISFDHDLGEEKNGYDIAKWIVNRDMELNGKYIPKSFYFTVHSANPVGKKNIEWYLNNYLKWRIKNET